jgi:hypothetical protein
MLTGMTFRQLGAVGVVLVVALAAPGLPPPGPVRAATGRDQPRLPTEGGVVLDGRATPVRGAVTDACCVAFSPDGYYVAFERSSGSGSSSTTAASSTESRARSGAGSGRPTGRPSRSSAKRHPAGRAEDGGF